MKQMKYTFSILISVLNVVAIGAIALLNLWYLQQHGKNMPMLIASGVGIVVLILLYKPIEAYRRRMREATKYDEFGRLKSLNVYNKMSVREQKELDKIRMIEFERILPYTTVKEMTARGSGNPEEELARLVGMKEVKEKMEEMAARMEFEKENEIDAVKTAHHMVFFGPPGTGKTTMARIMTGFLYKYGYITNNQIIEVSGGFLTGNDASQKVEAIVQRALGGVLFIDEAYAMLGGIFGNDAVAELIKQMEDKKDSFILILAGYEREMRELLQSNPGFLSRVKEFFYFNNYENDELLDIFVHMAQKEKYEVNDAAKEKFKKEINEATYDANFGNARTCRNILDKAINRHSLRVKRKEASHKFVLEEDDIIYEQVSLAQ